jgi:hypothetical protein
MIDTSWRLVCDTYQLQLLRDEGADPSEDMVVGWIVDVSCFSVVPRPPRIVRSLTFSDGLSFFIAIAAD